MNDHGGAGRPTRGQPRISSEHASTATGSRPRPDQVSSTDASSPTLGFVGSLRLTSALLLARCREHQTWAFTASAVMVYLLALRLNPFGVQAAWVSVLGLVVGALTLGVVMLWRLGCEQSGFPSGRRTGRRVLLTAMAAAVLPLGMAIVILPQRTNPAQADATATASGVSTGQVVSGRLGKALRANAAGLNSPPSTTAAQSTEAAVTADAAQQRSSSFGSGPQPTDWALVEAPRAWQPELPWIEVTPIDVSQQGSRDPARYAAVIDRFDVDEHRRYDFDHAFTYCNIFAWDVTKAMDVEIPHWYDEDTGLETPLGEGSEMSANRMDAWFDTHGTENGWSEVSAAEAANAAASGHPTLAIWRNPNPSRPGHVALIRPESQPGKLLIAQAGAKNFSMGKYEDVFSNITPRFFTHD